MHPARWVLLAIGTSIAMGAAASSDEPAASSYQGKSFQQWAAALQDRDPGACVSAVVALGQFGAPAVPSLIGALGHGDREVRETAVAVLTRLGRAGQGKLLEALQAGNAPQRAGAAEALGGMAPPPEAALRPLLTAIADADAGVRAKAAFALRGFGARAAPALVAALKDADLEVRGTAGFAVGYIGPEARAAVPQLIEFLSDKEQGLREVATVTLGRLGPAAVPALLDALQAKVPEVRERAADALGRIGAQRALGDTVPQAVAALTVALGDGVPPVRGTAALALGQIGPAAKSAIPRLSALLDDKLGGVRRDAAIGLGGVGPAAREAVPKLAAALGDTSADVRVKAARALGEVGTADDSTTDALRRALQDPDGVVRVAAASALGQLGAPAIPHLAAALADTDPVLCRRAAESLGRAAASAGKPAAVEALASAAKHRDAGVRWRAAQSLGAIGLAAKPALPALRRLLNDGDPEVRSKAVEAIQRIDPSATDKAASLAASDATRRAVERGLGRIEHGAVNWAANARCFSCHHQSLPLWALASARRRGFDVSPARIERQLEYSLDAFRPRAARIRAGESLRSGTTEAGYALLALSVAGSKRDDAAGALVEFLLKRQRSNGSWTTGADRPPSEGSPFTSTALALRGLLAYGGPAPVAEIDDLPEGARMAAAKGRSWLLASRPASTEDKVFRLHGLVSAGADAAQVAQARDVLLKEQRADGGWAQTAAMASDAYATGSVLVALRTAGLAPTEPAYQRGVKRLVATQAQDGAWIVPTRTPTVQIYFDNGDPGEKSQFLSHAATSWAVLALLECYPEG
jgi:N-acyl-D-amino-acid deacylase